jgi:hypothetical protein
MPEAGAVEEAEEGVFPEVALQGAVHSVQEVHPAVHEVHPDLLTEVVILKAADPANLINPVHSKIDLIINLKVNPLFKTDSLSVVPREKIISRTGRIGRTVVERTGSSMVKRNNQADRSMEIKQGVKGKSMPKDIITMNGMVDIAIMKTGKAVELL